MRHDHSLIPEGRFTAMPGALLLPLPLVFALCVLGYVFFLPHYQIPEQIPYWMVFFGLPHILASFQTVFDREYLSYYKKQILPVLAICLLPFVAYKLGVSPKSIFITYFILTVYHIVSQQHGIALATANLRNNPIAKICKWLIVAMGIVAYLKSYFAADLNNSETFALLLALTEFLSTPLLTAMTLAAGYLLWQRRAEPMAAIMLAVYLLPFILALIIILKTAYVLIGLMIARILHDVTAFVIYIKHDTNRNRKVRKNLLYRLFSFLPVWLLVPALAIAASAGIGQLARHVEFFMWLVIGISIAHYYIECFIWRSGTPHRRYFAWSGP
jgi:hypothetical protein